MSQVPPVVTVCLGRAEDAPAATLPPAELARLDRVGHPGARRLSHAAWATAVALIGARLGIPTDRVRLDRRCASCGDPEHGRPTLPGTSLRVSVSHSDPWFVIALADGVEIGVDVERRIEQPWSAGMRAIVLAPQESEPVDRTALWVRKEAVLKCIGDGLASPMAGLWLDGGRVVGWQAHPDLVERMRLYDLDAPEGYSAALAVLGEGRIDRVDLPLAVGSSG